MKPVIWVGSAKRNLVTCSSDVQAIAGRELNIVQRGDDPTDWKPMPSVGPGTRDSRPRRRRGSSVLRGDVSRSRLRAARLPEEDAQDGGSRSGARAAAASTDGDGKADPVKKRKVVEIETTNSVFFDLFERGKAERLSIQTGLALALEREIKARKLTQVAAARALGIAQPRVNDLLLRRYDRLSIDALFEYLSRLGVQVRIETSAPKRSRRAA
jgi:predicted XRE-type DNA-binding protein